MKMHDASESKNLSEEFDSKGEVLVISRENYFTLMFILLIFDKVIYG
jgi:hypothetical protein